MAESPCDRTIDTLYEEIKDESGSHFQCSICLRTLSRLQRMESHLTSIHGIGEICYIASHISFNFQGGVKREDDSSFKKNTSSPFLFTVGCRIRKYKKYDDDPSIPIPKSTKYDRVKRVKLSTSHVPALILHAPSLAFDSRLDVQNPAVEPSACQNSDLLVEERHSATGECSASSFEEFESEEVEPTSFSGHLADADEECDINDDTDTISSTSEASLESDSSSEEDSDDSADSIQNETTLELEKTFSAQTMACMSVLALISRHCITTEAAKDIIDLVKVLCPENDTMQSLTYSNVQQVCGNCELFVYDICEKCLGLFPTNLEDQVMCSTPGCNGYVNLSGFQY